MSHDPTVSDPDKYKVVFENVRVLEYRDRPGDRTSPHHHPDSVMCTLSSFERRLVHGDRETDVQLELGRTGWLAAQDHSGENIGTTDTHVLFVERGHNCDRSRDRAPRPTRRTHPRIPPSCSMNRHFESPQASLAYGAPSDAGWATPAASGVRLWVVGDMLEALLSVERRYVVVAALDDSERMRTVAGHTS